MECIREANYVQFVFGISGFSSILCKKNMVCIRKRKLSGVALVCRRAGSKRIKNVSSCVKQYYKKKLLFKQEVLLRQTTFVLNAYIVCCFSNGSGRAYDDNEYVDPSDLQNDNIYEYQQVQSVYDTDGHEEEIVLSDNAFECDSSESCPSSGCGETSSDASVEGIDSLSNDAADGFEVGEARHVSSDMVMLENSTDDPVVSAGESIDNEDESDYQSDNFSDTGCADATTISPVTAGVRGPQSKSVLFPEDCNKLVQVCRGMPRMQQCDDEVMSFQIESVREERLPFIHEDIFNKLLLYFLTFLNCIAYCNSRV